MTLGNVTSASASGLKFGTRYFFAVTAVDSTGLESDFSNEVSYTPATNLPPAIVLTSPSSGGSYSAPATLSLAATVTPNGNTITKVQFYNSATLLAEDTTAPYSYTWSGVGAGNYTLTSRAVYGSGATVTSSAIGVTVTVPSSPNTITLAPTSATLTTPFVVSSGMIYQTVASSVSSGGRAAFTFTVPTTGDYLVSAVVNAPNDSANSFYVNIDAEPVDPTMIWDIPVASSSTSRTVAWRGNGTVSASQFAPKVFNLIAGSHQLIIRGREANTRLGTVTITPAASLPAPWQAIDIGSVGVTGSATSTSGVYTVSGAGTISGSSDQFRFLYQPLSGDGEIRARISSLQNSSSAARAGVMIRESLTGGSRYAFVGISPNGTFRTQRRTATAGTTSSATSGSAVLPNGWVRLVRQGNTLYSYKSANGSNWSLISSNSVSMAGNIYAGFAVASGSNTVSTKASFGNATVVP